jgi:iron-sulfur cluster assembly protein
MISITLPEGERLLEGLLRQGHEIAHDCERSLACASCRVIVREGLEHLSPAGEDEQDILDRASLTEPGSRLTCQAIAAGGDLVVEIPCEEPPRLARPSQEHGRPISLSERAVRHFAVQLTRHPSAAAVRLSVHSAGCSGFSYRVDFAEALREDDVVFESGRICFAVDPLSLPYVQGAHLDVVQEGLARRLRFDNPNARQTCGCGESFGV